jgi:predicted phage terminase large subunit-like protein
MTALPKPEEIELCKRALARRKLIEFTKYTMPAYQATSMHRKYAEILDYFIQGKIKKLIISEPPQHGKSELSSRRIPAFLLGINPNLKITIASYSTTFARKFNVDVQRIIGDNLYHNLFPKTTISGTKYTEKSDNKYTKTKDECEIINHTGILRSVGRGGSLTGNPVDIMIMDDLYKDYAEGNSPIIREATIDWYKSVVRTRLHNNSQQLIVFTRWHEDDLVGFLEKHEEENIVELVEYEQLENIDNETWYRINFPALSTTSSIENEFDIRTELNVPLWPEKHSKKKLESDRALDPEKFESLHQGDPRPKVGLLYISGFNTYTKKPGFKNVQSYTDTADVGNDWLCHITYGIGEDNNIYILDVYYTIEPQEITEPETAKRIKEFNPNPATVESNSGGRAFARNIDRLSGYRYNIQWFHQGENKESRIITNSAQIQRLIYFPLNWTGKWPEFARDLLKFKMNFKSNKHDCAPDALTGCYEFSGLADNMYSLYRS